MHCPVVEFSVLWGLEFEVTEASQLYITLFDDSHDLLRTTSISASELRAAGPTVSVVLQQDASIGMIEVDILLRARVCCVVIGWRVSLTVI